MKRTLAVIVLVVVIHGGWLALMYWFLVTKASWTIGEFAAFVAAFTYMDLKLEKMLEEARKRR